MIFFTKCASREKFLLCSCFGRLQAILEVFIYFSKQFHVSIEVAEKAACFQSTETLWFSSAHWFVVINNISQEVNIRFSHCRILTFEHFNVLKHGNKLMFQSFWCLNLKDVTTQHLCYLVFALSKLQFTQKEWNILDEAHQRTYIKLLCNVCDLMNFTWLWNVKKQRSNRTQNTTMFCSLVFFLQWNKEKFIPRTWCSLVV